MYKLNDDYSLLRETFYLDFSLQASFNVMSAFINLQSKDA